jgi:hypothetical protein
MGGIISSSGGIKDRLKEKTQGTTRVMDNILDYILKEVTLIDFYSLADPDRCRNYLVAGQEALESLFREIDLYPQQKDGLIYIQSIRGLQKGLDAKRVGIQNKYCLEIAFFFIRIFQIFGALTLSVMDVNIPQTDYELEQEERKSKMAQQGSYLQYVPLFGQRGGRLTGAYEIDPESIYSILNDYLRTPRSADDQNQTFFIGYPELYVYLDALRASAPIVHYKYNKSPGDVGEIEAALTIEGNKNEIIVTLSNFTTERGKGVIQEQKLTRNSRDIFTYQSNRQIEDFIYEAMKRVAPQPPFSILEFLKRYSYVNRSSIPTQSVSIMGTRVTVYANQPNRPVTIKYSGSIKLDEKDVAFSIENCTLDIEPDSTDSNKFKVSIRFDGRKIVARDRDISRRIEESLKFKEEGVKMNIFELKDVGGNPTPLNDKNETIPQYLEKVFKRIVEKRAGEDEYFKQFSKTKQGFVRPHDSDNIPAPLRIKKIWEALVQDPPVKAFCTARALQLLNPSALEGNMPEEALSSVCRTTFHHQKIGSVPAQGKTIDTAEGIRALVPLFFEMAEDRTQIVDRADEKYKQAFQYLKQQFAHVEPVTAVPVTAAVDKLQTIKEGAPEFCQGTDQPIRIRNPDVIRGLQAAARALIDRQINHTANVMNIITKLFIVESSQPVRFNPLVMKGGMPYINKVAAAARELLIDYYADCETGYNKGLAVLRQAAGRKKQAVPS